MKVAVTGATGYVGGRLVPALIEQGHEILCLTRSPKKLDDRHWRHDPKVEVIADDVTDHEALTQKLAGCDVAYYLIHSMQASGSEYAKEDRKLAELFSRAAKAAGVRRIIYLGGLGEMGPNLSEHLSSRREIEQILEQAGVPVTTFRAAMIIGSGSASFEILRYLVERLPIMVTPRWVKTESQPIAIADVLYWLVKCLEVPETEGQTLEIGGKDVIQYRELMRIMAKELGLSKRIIIPLPVLTPKLSSAWIGLVTPVSYKMARPLAEGLRNRVVVTNNLTQTLMPHETIGVQEAIHKALDRIRADEVITSWSAAGPVPGDPEWAGGTVFKDQRTIEISASEGDVFRAVCRIGGGHGWYAGDYLWRIRGWMDKLVGGPGLRRGRRHSEKVTFGEALDFWRVIGVDENKRLTLLAEMKLPGTAMLEFGLEPGADSKTRMTMTARFRPKGIFGLIYWYIVVPFHNIVFGGMLQGIKSAAESGNGIKK